MHDKHPVRQHEKKEHPHKKHKLQNLGKESMEEIMRREAEKHPGGG